MKYTQLNKGQIGGLLSRYESLLKEVKVYQPTSLFHVEPNWELLRSLRCPVCGSLLKFPLKRSVAICRGKRHGDKRPFIIQNKILHKFIK